MVATFQSTVNIWSTPGIVGDLAYDGPLRAEPYNLFSSGTPNLVGNVFTVSAGANPNSTTAAGNAGNATVGGTGVFAGILINSKDYASYGTTSGALNPTITLPDYTIGFLATMGYFWVNLPGPANVGDLVTYDPLTGNLNSIAPTAKFTASIVAGGTAGTNDLLEVSAITAGSIQVGMLVSGAGVAGGTYVSSFGTGVGGTGHYNLTSINEQAVSSEAMTGNNMPAPAWAASSAYITTSAGVDTLHITSLTSGDLYPGTLVTGTGVAANTVVTAFSSGEGGTGTYTLNTSGQTVASSGSPIAMSGPSNLFVPHCVVDRFTANTLGGLAVIQLTN